MFAHTLSTSELAKFVISLYCIPSLMYSITPPPCLFRFFLTVVYPSIHISLSATLSSKNVSHIRCTVYDLTDSQLWFRNMDLRNVITYLRISWTEHFHRWPAQSPPSLMESFSGDRVSRFTGFNGHLERKADITFDMMIDGNMESVPEKDLNQLAE